MELYALRNNSMLDSDVHEVEIYYLEEIIQKGKGCTRLLKASHQDSDETVAIKLFPKSSSSSSNSGFLNEEETVTTLSHPNLVKYHNFYKDALIKGKNGDFCKYSAVVMEYISSGDLFHYVSNNNLSEKVARTLFNQMLTVIEYLHAQNIVHLDLKPENFLITETGIKLIDFDGAQNLQANACVSLPAGTPGYRPPEFIKGGYQELRSADIYSLGIVLFIMVTGTPPYTELEEDKVYKFDQYYDALRKDTKKFWKVHDHYRADDNRKPFSQEFKNLIEGMLRENPQDRLKLDEIRRSKWFDGATCTAQELKRELGCHV